MKEKRACLASMPASLVPVAQHASGHGLGRGVGQSMTQMRFCLIASIRASERLGDQESRFALMRIDRNDPVEYLNGVGVAPELDELLGGI